MNLTQSGLLYLLAAVLFIFTLRGLSSPTSSKWGNFFGILGMIVAIVTTILMIPEIDYVLATSAIIIGGTIGTVIALRLQMTALPQLVAAFHSLVGLAAVFVAMAAFYAPEYYGIANQALGVSGVTVHGQIFKTGSLIELSIGLAIGAVTYSGSLVAFAKLQGILGGKPLVFRGQHTLNAILFLTIIALIVLLVQQQSSWLLWLLAFVAVVFGFLLIMPIGGADMPVIVSMLNSYSGWAACGIGFTLNNYLLIITGALVGASGAILSYIMCKGMNRSIIKVVLGGFGASASGATNSSTPDKPIKTGSAEDAAFIMKNARLAIIVPGYGMAVAQAQHVLREMADLLKKEGVRVAYAIHPVAGRMPGHMNVLLAEANVPYDEVFELEDINPEFATADVAFVIGANDVTNPSAKTDRSSPIYGMPVLEVEKAKTVLFIKRSMASGYAGVENPLFFRDNTLMLFGDAKKVCEEIVKSLA
ncbi:MAG: NAD(P)(+) transhydrogenase (Re/Si-specific) subunit beta [Alphaproteobacteria bacterium]|nr:NAD(P)(+) transhydrogenase (Re/Si-specific) subunit beta [Alphaproteobacteria bacterium]